MAKLVKIDNCISCPHCLLSHAYERGKPEYECHENSNKILDVFNADVVHDECPLSESIGSPITCPLCNHGILKYKNRGAAHMWICPECPCIVFEYWDQASYKDLGKHLSIITD